MDDKIFNFGDLVKLSTHGEATLGKNEVGRRLMNQNGIIVSDLVEKINMIGYEVLFATEDKIFLSIDEIARVKQG
jgi:hypothetical protein